MTNGYINRESTVSELGLAIYTSRLGSRYSCDECGVMFKVGDRIVTRNRNGRTQRYHVLCWDGKHIG